MNIAVICPYALDVPGGVQGQALGMSRAFARDHQVTLVSPGEHAPRELAHTPINVVLLGRTVGVKANGSVAPVALSPRAVHACREVLLDSEIDLLIIHEPLVPVTSVTALFGGTPIKIGVFHRSGISRLLPLLRPFASPLLSRLDYGVVVSEEARKTIRVLVGNRADGYAQISNAVDVDRFATPHPLARKPKSILFLGRHERRKGLAVLIDAMRRLPAEFSLMVAGTGPETSALERQCSGDPRVTWLGRISDAEAALRLQESELFVAPAIGGESFGVVLLEAMAAGAPVLCSDIPGFRLAAGDAASYFPVGDAPQLANEIVRLSGAAGTRAAMSARGLARAATCDFAALATRYLELIER